MRGDSECADDMMHNFEDTQVHVLEIPLCASTFATTRW